MPNHLADATSPYLLSHAANPVDWFGWGSDAFDEARSRDLPLLISVGYSSCHWCHVMALESFSDPEVAEVVNEYFVPVKVDREENPEVDASLMQATLALTGSGGWPNTVFCTPDGRPFFAGTYFPPEPRDGQPAFVDVVRALGQAWQERRDEVVQQAGVITDQLRAMASAQEPDDGAATGMPTAQELLDAVSTDYDIVNGGFGGPTKFPTPTLIDALLVKGDPTSLDMAQNTCEHLVRGGIFDQVGGGFHRYSTDSQWTVPHFEKMLNDNGLLLGTMARCWRRTADHDPDRRALYDHAVRRTVDWLRREMTTEEGLLAASLDADSDDLAGHTHEGIFYLWNPQLLVDALGEEEAGWLRPLLHLGDQGNFEGDLSTLQMRGRLDWERINADLDRMLEYRALRSRPARDEKVVTAWNAMVIDSLVEAGMILREWSWVEWAGELADKLWRAHWQGGRLLRTSLHGRPGTGAVTEDHAHLGLALAGLAGATGRRVWLDRAVEVLDAAVDRFSEPDGGFADAAASDLVVAPARTLTDDANPSPTSAMVKALRRVGLMAGREDLVERADLASRRLARVIVGAPRYAGWALADHLISDDARRGLRPAAVVVVEEDAEPGELAAAAWRMAPSGSALMRGAAGTDGFAEWFDERGDEQGPTAYVCRGTVCFEPVTDYLELKDPLWRRV